MRLIDAILEVDQAHAVTEATVAAQWPLTTADGASPLVLIELAAQTAGVCFGWQESQKPVDLRDAARGWLVGIKKAQFHIDRIRLPSCIVTRTQIFVQVEQYKEVVATATLGGRMIAEIHLQVLQADQSAFHDPAD
jgi:predicted hotdog family 3-hydroxylacyl-ACP dehydratase